MSITALPIQMDLVGAIRVSTMSMDQRPQAHPLEPFDLGG
jgi:hypothetical protein